MPYSNIFLFFTFVVLLFFLCILPLSSLLSSLNVAYLIIVYYCIYILSLHPSLYFISFATAFLQFIPCDLALFCLCSSLLHVHLVRCGVCFVLCRHFYNGGLPTYTGRRHLAFVRLLDICDCYDVIASFGGVSVRAPPFSLPTSYI